ncbi:NAD(P)/FAD-dependent oxidoreductase [Methanoregula sp. UBA64]|jgi:predicted Rossmann fold flavoprotein|uniref:NAD(P)/FAD-dependent oxidoreductase n=1 Tax=Methanoregula sp. UBA64 TaxID=1915554 RepID=UPI0025DA2918|nr:NAD(P)/FAD-dependent oxidoreductase [Methanoregula sp. UBA64]
MQAHTPAYDIAITGAGPAGLFCAIHAAASGATVIIFEKNPEPGEKLCISGTGQCNITHSGDIRDFFLRYGANGKFLRPALLGHTNEDLIRFFGDRGIAMEVTDGGKVFPANRSAPAILRILTEECRTRGVDLKCGEPITGIQRAAHSFSISANDRDYSAKMLVIATGGMSYPKTGSTGDGYRFAGALGHTITEPGPALTPLIIDDYPFSSLAGISFPGLPFSVWRDSRKIFDRNGDVLLTHAGLSGPGILDCSRDIRAGDVIRLAFAGKAQRETVERTFLDLVQTNPTRLVKTLVTHTGVPERLAESLVHLAGVPMDCTGAHLPAALRKKLSDLLAGCPLTVKALGNFSVAMVTRGGVALKEVHSKTMESRIVPGLFFAGEVLDIDGDTGGYNLQAAFSTGYCAAQGCTARLKERQ